MAIRQFYRPDEVAQILKVSRRTVERWIACGIIEAIKINNTLRIPSEEFERVIEEGKERIMEDND